MRWLIILFLSFPAWGKIQEIRTLKEILPAIDAETLLIFDLDNTLVEPVQSFGSDQWYEAAVQENEKKGMSRDAAIDRTLERWVKIQKITLVKAVEPSSPEVFSQARRKAKAVMAMTARPADLAESTTAQLKGLGIDFSPSNERVDIEGKGLYRRGILFLGAKANKGAGLTAFLKVTEMKPKKIVFVDDKSRHVESVEAALKGTGIEYVGFRYGAADERVKAFRMEQANEEAKKFGSLVN